MELQLFHWKSFLEDNIVSDKTENETENEDLDNTPKYQSSSTSYDISLITASAANLHKKVKDLNDGDYSYDTWTTINGDYSYRWRYQNTFNTKATNNETKVLKLNNTNDNPQRTIVLNLIVLNVSTL